MELLQRLFGGGGRSERMERPHLRRRDISPDQRVIERYRYLLRTAPPATIEEGHAEAFAQLTPEQRRLVLRELSQSLTPGERAAAANASDDPGQLARLATRAEMRQSGTLERTWSGMPAMPGNAGAGTGGFMMNNFLSSFAGVIVGGIVADAFLGSVGYDQGYADGVDAASADTSGDSDVDGSEVAESGSFDDAGGFGDFGSDTDGFGDFGGDIGGDF